jgi:hypothetical protein
MIGCGPRCGEVFSRAVDKLCQAGENKNKQHSPTEKLDIKRFRIVYNIG